MAAPTSHKLSNCDFSQEPVNIKVGPQAKIFKLNPSILAANSKVFRKGLSERWQSVQKDGFSFASIDAEIFNQYASWCHHNDIDVVAGKLDSDSSEEVRNQHYERLANIFILADFLDDKVLRNSVMDKMLESFGETNQNPGLHAIKLAFNNLPGSSTLCRLLIDVAVTSTATYDWVRKYGNGAPGQYLVSLLWAYAKASQDGSLPGTKPVDVVKQAPCTYHEHDEETPPGAKCQPQASVNETPKKSPGKTTKKRRL